MIQHLSWLIWLIWLVLTSGCSHLDSLSNPFIGTPKQFQSRQIIVTLSEDVRKQWQDINREIQNQFDVQLAGQFPLTSIRVNCLVYRVSEMVDVDEVMRRLRADERLQLVQSNQVFAGLQAQRTSYAGLSYGPRIIHADLVHQQMITGKAQRIAIIDTGADKDHPELKGQIIATENFVEGGNENYAQDRHGTAVAGIIAAHIDNIGIDGIAPDAKIDMYKACWYEAQNQGKALCSSWTLAKAIDAAINAGNRIINLSLNGPEDPLLKQLLLTANQRHIVVVAAALERETAPGFPASLAFVIPVISVNPTGEAVAPNWNNAESALAAPGVEVLSTAPGEGYEFYSGSSLAAAHISGVVALLLQQQPTLQPDAIKVLLLRTGRVKYSNQDKSRTFVTVDACRAVAALGKQLDCP